MFERDKELAPDLEWLLGSGQADRELLVEALVDEYYAQLVQLGRALLEDPSQAERLANSTLTRAILEAHTYHNNQAVQTWLYEVAIQTYRRMRPFSNLRRRFRGRFQRAGGSPSAVDNPTNTSPLSVAVQRLDDRMRIPLILYSLFGFDEKRLGQMPSLGKDAALMALKAARQILLLNAGQHGLNPGTLHEGLDEPLRASLLTVYQPVETTPASLQEVAALVLQRAGEEGTRNRGFIFLKEFAFIGLAALVFGSMLWGSNQLFPAPTPSQLPVIRWVTNTPTPIPTPTPTRAFYPPVPEGALYSVQPGDTLEGIAGRLDIDSETLRRLNRIALNDQPSAGQLLLIPGRITPGSLPLAPQVTPQPFVEPLTAQSSPEQVLGRLNDMIDPDRVGTAWFDIQIAYYGPAGYYGPVQTYRLQLWLSFSHGLFLILGGPLDGFPAEALMAVQDNIVIARPGAGDPWFRVVVDEGLQVQAWELFRYLAIASIISTESFEDIRMVGSSQWAGRPAVIIESVTGPSWPREQVWVDANTGWPLRSLVFGPGSTHIVSEGETLSRIAETHQTTVTELARINAIPNPDVLSMGEHLAIPGPLEAEMRVTGVVYGANFDQALFDPWLPWRGGYAADFAGRPIAAENQMPNWITRKERTPPEKTSPPADFNPSTYPLSVSFATDPDLFNTPPSKMYPADLYAAAETGLFSLGQLTLPNPFSMICERSPDGRWLALTSTNFSEISEPLYLVDLLNPAVGDKIELAIKATEFAFSPDGRHLAILAPEQNGVDQGLYLVVLDDQHVTPLRAGVYGSSLAWSPDGAQIAFIGGTSPYIQSQLLVIKIENAQTTASLSVPLIAGMPAFDKSASDWPLKGWEIDFPASPGQLSDCLAAP